MRIKIAAFSVLMLGIFLITGSRNVKAVGNDENITLSPAVIKPNFETGKSTEGKIKVINNGSTDYRFIVYARPFSVKDETYDPDFETINKQTNLFEWVKFPKSDFYLKTGDSVEVPYVISIPNDARPGGHYAVLFAETQAPKETQSVLRKKRVGSLVYGTVGGALSQSGALEKIESKKWFTSAPITSDIYIRNDGNVHFEAKTDVVYKNLFGKAVFGSQQTRMIMPGTTRKVTTSWSKPPLFGIYKLAGEVGYLNKKEQLPQKFVFLLPTSLFIAIIGVVVFIVMYNILRRKQRK